MSLTNARFDSTISYMDKENTLLEYALTPHLGRSEKSAKVARYSAQMKNRGTFSFEDLQDALAKESGASLEYIRYLEELRQKIIVDALKSGKILYLNGIAIESALRGSFPTIDSEFDETKHKLAVTSFTYGAFQNCLKGVVPVNTIKSGTPTLSRINEAGQEDGVIVGCDELTITGRGLAPEVSRTDEGVFLVALKTGERVASATITTSNLVLVVCTFDQLPPAGRYRLVVATRCGLGTDRKVVEAGREIEVR